jgi:hypothetical protein
LTAEIARAVPPLVGMGAAIFAGSLLTALFLARPKTARLAPYALAAAALIAVDLIAVRVLPHAEAFKPIPRLAAIIQRDRRPGDVVAIQQVSGGNALLFYTHPVVRALAATDDGDPQADGVDPRAFICSAPRAWVIVPAETSAYDPPYGRDRRVVAVDRKAALLLYSGPRCK